MMLSLSRPYAAREGAPIVDRVDPRIFTFTYYRHCMECGFCQDSCCQYGADVEVVRVNAINARAAELEQYLGSSREDWFRTDPEDVGMLPEPEYPGGFYTRTGIVELPAGRSGHNADACVFLDPEGRGCRLHRFAIDRGIDVHAIKPMVCLLFPVYFTEGLLFPAIEFELEDLVCMGAGDTVYRGAREDLLWYFGAELVAELDAFERAAVTTGPGMALPMVA